MKKPLKILLFAFCLFMLTACGAENSVFGNQEPATEFYDIRVEETEVFHAGLSGTYLGVQFYGEDIIQVLLWQDGVRMQKAGGGSEIILPEYGFFTGNWFLTSEGKSVLFYDEISGGGVRVLDSNGERLFFLDDILGLSICETADRKVYLLAEEEGSVFLAQLNMDSGSLRRVEGLAFNQISNLTTRPYRCLGLGSEALMLLDSEGIWEIEEDENRAAKSIVLSFDSTSYMDMISNPSSNPNYDLRDISAFHVLEDGSAELLWKYKDSGKSPLQILSYEKTEKQILRLRCTSISGWMTECITEFNRSSENYQVVLEQPTSSDWTDFRQRTDMEIGAGKGADLIIGQASENFNALIEKGALEDITPYLERSGINRADYFPAVFAQKEGQKTIYGISPEISLKSLWISREVLRDTQEINIETLVNALNDYSGKGSIYVYPSSYILRFLLEGSENFGGMVNYEKRSCDFDSELFIKFLNIAKRYGGKSYMDSPSVIGERLVQTLGYFESKEELNLQAKLLSVIFSITASILRCHGETCLQ